MGGFKPSKPPKPPPEPKPPPTEKNNAAVEEARRKELAVARNTRGRAPMLLANQADLGLAPVARKTLLGQ